MNKNSTRKFAVAMAFAMVLSSLLVTQAFANEIKVFAPLNYGGVPPSFPFPFNPWGTFATPASSSALINPPDGSTTLNAVPTGNVSGLAMSWFDTGWHNYTGPIQPGAVHSDTWLNYRIRGWGAGFFAFLWVFEYDPVAGTFQYWTKTHSTVCLEPDTTRSTWELSQATSQTLAINSCGPLGAGTIQEYCCYQSLPLEPLQLATGNSKIYSILHTSAHLRTIGTLLTLNHSHPHMSNPFSDRLE